MMRALTPRGIHQGLSLRPTVSICSASRSSNMDAKQSKSITPSKRKFKNSDEQTQTDRDKETKVHPDGSKACRSCTVTMNVEICKRFAGSLVCGVDAAH